MYYTLCIQLVLYTCTYLQVLLWALFVVGVLKVILTGIRYFVKLLQIHHTGTVADSVFICSDTMH